MRKLIWKSSIWAFVPALAGLAAVPILGAEGLGSIAAGGAMAALAFGSFLEIAQSATTTTGFRSILPMVIPVAALLALGFLGAVSMDLLSQKSLRPESFVAGLLAGTLFSQYALLRASQRLAEAEVRN